MFESRPQPFCLFFRLPRDADEVTPAAIIIATTITTTTTVRMTHLLSLLLNRPESSPPSYSSSILYPHLVSSALEACESNSQGGDLQASIRVCSPFLPVKGDKTNFVL